MSQSGIQDARTAAYRALCLGALLTRTGLETVVQRLYADDVPEGVRRYITARHWTDNQRLLKWIEDEALGPHLSRAERLLLAKPFATWSDRNLNVATWRSESAGVILWALRFIDFVPPFDTRFDMSQVMTLLDVYHPTIDFIWQAGLRPAEEVQRMRDTADLWNWRARAAELEHMGITPPAGMSFAEIIRITAEQGYHGGLLPRPVAGDFPVFGAAYVHMSQAQALTVSHIAHQRCAALNWLCELSSEWENLPVDNV